MGVAFFDLDRTLIDCNSGRLWVEEEWREGNIGLGTVAWASWYLGRYSLGFEDDLEKVFEAAVHKVRGQSEAEMEARVRVWFDRAVAHRLRPGAQVALEKHRAAGDQLIVATSSSPYAGRAAMDTFGLDGLVSTRFEIEAGRFTGRVDVAAVGVGKLTEAREWASAQEVNLAECAFYTDSYTDLPLLEAVGEPTVVNPDRRLKRLAMERGWPVVDWG
jgi:HAD superfamily hydrolase (TIGR01490 family)